MSPSTFCLCLKHLGARIASRNAPVSRCSLPGSVGPTPLTFYFTYNHVPNCVYLQCVKHTYKHVYVGAAQCACGCACTDSPRGDPGVGSQHDTSVELDGNDSGLQPQWRQCVSKMKDCAAYQTRTRRACWRPYPSFHLLRQPFRLGFRQHPNSLPRQPLRFVGLEAQFNVPSGWNVAFGGQPSSGGRFNCSASCDLHVFQRQMESES